MKQIILSLYIMVGIIPSIFGMMPVHNPRISESFIELIDLKNKKIAISYESFCSEKLQKLLKEATALIADLTKTAALQLRYGVPIADIEKNLHAVVKELQEVLRIKATNPNAVFYRQPGATSATVVQNFNDVFNALYAKQQINYNNLSVSFLYSTLATAQQNLTNLTNSPTMRVAQAVQVEPRNLWFLANEVKEDLQKALQSLLSPVRQAPIAPVQPVRVSALPVPVQSNPVPVPTCALQPAPLLSVSSKVCLIDLAKIPKLVIGRRPVDQNSVLIQLKTVNQSDERMASRFGGETCPILALHNSFLVLQAANNCAVEPLLKLDQEDAAQSFINLMGSCRKDWNSLTTQELQQIISRAHLPASLQNKIAIVDSVIDFGKSSDEVGTDIAQKMQKIFNDIRSGMQQEYFSYSMVLGDSEFTSCKLRQGSLMHYVSFTIIKAGNLIQYIIVDSLGNQSHINGMYKAQLDYLIALVERGYLKTRYNEYLHYLRTDALQDMERREREYEDMLRKMYGQP